MNYKTGSNKSPYDIRTFTYKPDKANISGGIRWTEKDIQHQYNVGICTAISLTMRASKYYGVKMSADFQYLLQKKYIDKNWDEGSSAFSALKVGNEYGFIPASELENYIKEGDRKLTYSDYIHKLKLIPESEIERLVQKYKNKYRVSAYASVPINRDLLANATDESEGALLCRFVIGSEWWTAPIEPLRNPSLVISGHLVNQTNYDGNTFRIANSWGTEWSPKAIVKGTAYYKFDNYKPTEAWKLWFSDEIIPEQIEVQKDSREKLVGLILDYIQKIIVLLGQLIK